MLQLVHPLSQFLIPSPHHAGLLIELWKITKVVDIRVDWSSQVLGLLPRVSFVDRESYTESSTKKYDMVRIGGLLARRSIWLQLYRTLQQHDVVVD